MKKGLFVLAVLVMALGNVSFAQRKAELKSNANANVLKHYGVRDETTVVPATAFWETTDGEQYRTTYTYDEYDYYLTEELTEVNYGDGWLEFSLLTYDYDFSGNVIEIVAQIMEDGGWENEARASYTYDDDLVTEVIIQEWENGNWENETKEVYNYSGDVTTVLYWDWNGSNWSSDELWTYTKDGNTIELIIQYMQGGAWQNDEKQLLTLDFDEHVTEILDQDWVGTSWVNDERTTYIYEDGVFTNKNVEDWNGSAWEDDLTFEYEYVDGNAKHGECFEKEAGQWTPADDDIEMAFGYGAKSNEYYGYRVDIQYVDLTQVGENTTASFVVYPVPAQDVLFIETDSFQKAEIYSLSGQKVMESLRDRMNVSALSSGMYLIKVYDREGGCSSQRFVVK
jgi:hypothetical protein